ncbi:MAG: DUF1667 domain-containing protein [Enterocloster bolteae]
MLREYTCIICPNGCDIRAQIEEREDGSRRICSVEGAACPKGRAYVEQELTDPREYCHICIGKGRACFLASVRLTNPIPRDRIFDAVSEIKKYTLTAPVKAGTVVIPRLMGYDTDVIVTKSVPENR